MNINELTHDGLFPQIQSYTDGEPRYFAVLQRLSPQHFGYILHTDHPALAVMDGTGISAMVFHQHAEALGFTRWVPVEPCYPLLVVRLAAVALYRWLEREPANLMLADELVYGPLTKNDFNVNTWARLRTGVNAMRVHLDTVCRALADFDTSMTLSTVFDRKYDQGDYHRTDLRLGLVSVYNAARDVVLAVEENQENGSDDHPYRAAYAGSNTVMVYLESCFAKWEATAGTSNLQTVLEEVVSELGYNLSEQTTPTLSPDLLLHRSKKARRAMLRRDEATTAGTYGRMPEPLDTINPPPIDVLAAGEDALFEATAPKPNYRLLQPSDLDRLPEEIRDILPTDPISRPHMSELAERMLQSRKGTVPNPAPWLDVHTNPPPLPASTPTPDQYLEGEILAGLHLPYTSLAEWQRAADAPPFPTFPHWTEGPPRQFLETVELEPTPETREIGDPAHERPTDGAAS